MTSAHCDPPVALVRPPLFPKTKPNNTKQKLSSDWKIEHNVNINRSHTARTPSRRSSLLSQLPPRRRSLDPPTHRRRPLQATDLPPAKVHLRIHRSGRDYNGIDTRRCLCYTEETFQNWNIDGCLFFLLVKGHRDRHIFVCLDFGSSYTSSQSRKREID
jgi:hypothetical protein